MSQVYTARLLSTDSRATKRGGVQTVSSRSLNLDASGVRLRADLFGTEAVRLFALCTPATNMQAALKEPSQLYLHVPLRTELTISTAAYVDFEKLVMLNLDRTRSRVSIWFHFISFHVASGSLGTQPNGK